MDDKIISGIFEEPQDEHHQVFTNLLDDMGETGRKDNCILCLGPITDATIASLRDEAHLRVPDRVCEECYLNPKESESVEVLQENVNMHFLFVIVVDVLVTGHEEQKWANFDYESRKTYALNILEGSLRKMQNR